MYSSVISVNFELEKLFIGFVLMYIYVDSLFSIICCDVVVAHLLACNLSLVDRDWIC